MKRILLILCLLIPVMAGAFDKTPYKWMIAGNYYSGARTVDSLWLAERFDAAIAGLSDFPGLFEDIYFIRLDSGESFNFGPYASIMEVNLATSYYDSVTTYETRMGLSSSWLYVYSKDYLDSIGVDVESLVVHIADDSWTLYNIAGKGDGKTRSAVAAGHTHPRKRFNYQSWQNATTDSANGGPFWPSGYVWLANGKNTDAQNAIANAYRRHLIEDSSGYEDGAVMYTAYFSDNYYRDQPDMHQYTTSPASSGGPTSGLDLYEQSSFYTPADSLYAFFDNHYCPLSDRVRDVLDSTTTANGLNKIIGFMNINKSSVTHLGKVLPYCNGVSLEGPIDYQKGPPFWRTFYAMADTMAAHPEVYINWGLNTNVILDTTTGSWRRDSARVYLTHYAFFLQVRDTNAYMSPGFWSQSFRWRDIHEVNFGEPDSAAWTVSYTGNSDYGGTPYIYVKERTYNSGTVVVLFRTAHSTADYAADSVSVNLHDLYKEVDANADTSETADSIFYLRPYDGKILIMAGEVPPNISGLSSSKDTIAVQTTITATCTDDYGIDSVDLFIYLPDSTAWENDSVSILDTLLGADETTYNLSETYTWGQTGGHLIYLTLVDSSGNVKVGSLYVDVQAAGEPPGPSGTANIHRGYSGKGLKGGG